MLYEIRPFNAKGSVMHVILDSRDIEILDNIVDSGEDLYTLRDESDVEKYERLKTLFAALVALNNVEKMAREG